MRIVKTAVLKWVISPVSYSPIVAGLARERLQRTINVIYYHYVGAPVPYYGEDNTDYRLEHFRRDLERLSRYFEFAPLRSVAEGAKSKSGKPLAAITFDDGFDMIGNGATEALNDYGISATTFLITACVDNKRLMWRNKLTTIRTQVRPAEYLRAYNSVAAECGFARIDHPGQIMSASCRWPADRQEAWVDRLWNACGMETEGAFLARYQPYFSWERLERWISEGHSIGLHTATHPFCSRLTASGVDFEIREPARMLKERFSISWLPLSYPFGDCLDEGTARHLCEEGVLSCTFGINGFSWSGTPNHRLERAYGQGHHRFELFVKPLLDTWRGRSLPTFSTDGGTSTNPRGRNVELQTQGCKSAYGIPATSTIVFP